MKIVIRRFLWWVLLFILSWRKSWDEFLILWCLFHILISVFFFQDIIHQRSQRLFRESTAYTSKLTRYWGEIWEDPKHDSWWMYIRLFLLSWYCPCYFILLLLSYAMHALPLQLLLLNLGENGKTLGVPLVQKKILILYDGNSASSCCNLENIRYKILFLEKFRIPNNNGIFSLQYLYK